MKKQKFEKEIVFESSVLAWIRNRIRNWIRIEQNAGSGSVLNQSGSTTLEISTVVRTSNKTGKSLIQEKF
jgi:hypothetical protein